MHPVDPGDPMKKGKVSHIPPINILQLAGCALKTLKASLTLYKTHPYKKFMADMKEWWPFFNQKKILNVLCFHIEMCYPKCKKAN